MTSCGVESLPLDSIDILFEDIDGSGGTLAQADFVDDVNPVKIAGDIMFDISENWEVGNSLGAAACDLVYVMVHELGHSLGLEHSDSPGSVLYPSVSANQELTALAEEDVDAALALNAPAEEDTTTSADPTDEVLDDTSTDTKEDAPANVPDEDEATEEPPVADLPPSHHSRDHGQPRGISRDGSGEGTSQRVEVGVRSSLFRTPSILQQGTCRTIGFGFIRADSSA
ncbi:matrixin family metalloprotease [Bremerella cremea]|uniref:matrixin family metalloprotease n=1 Tax=Bremerella cremea TaxID=1031537 RepID=UPI0031EE15CF